MNKIPPLLTQLPPLKKGGQGGFRNWVEITTRRGALYAGVRPDLLPSVVDRNPAKKGKFLPGSRIPIVAEARLHEEKPDVVLILPWNLKEEVMAQLSYIQEWDGRFVMAVPYVVDAGMSVSEGRGMQE